MRAPYSPPQASSCPYSRRQFLRTAAVLAAAPWASAAARADEADEGEIPRRPVAPPPPVFSPSAKAGAKVALVRCRTYGPAVHGALERAFDLLGGIAGLVRGKTVTVKLNLTGTNFDPVFRRPPGDSYMTHPDSALALATLLFKAGCTRVRFVESTNRIEPLEQTVTDAGWDTRAFAALGRVEWENTRNLGTGRQYATVKVPSGGHLFSSFDLNHAYHDTDVVVSLAKLKNHLTCGVTLAMKNLFGITPNALYGGQAPYEKATEGRGPLHHRREYQGSGSMPGEIRGAFPDDPGFRVPRIVADLCEARPVHLSIVDGIVSMKGGEGPWAPDIRLTTPGLLVVGLNPVSTDAVGTAVMGYPDPRAVKRTPPFDWCDNHLLLAEQRGVGVLELKQIEILGERLADVIYPYA